MKTQNTQKIVVVYTLKKTVMSLMYDFSEFSPALINTIVKLLFTYQKYRHWSFGKGKRTTKRGFFTSKTAF